MGDLPAGDGRRVLGGRLLLRPPVAPDARRPGRPDQRRLGRLGVRGLDPPRHPGRRSEVCAPAPELGGDREELSQGQGGVQAKYGLAEAAEGQGREQAGRGSRAIRTDDARQRPAGQHLQRRAQADDRLRHPRRHLVPGRDQRRPGVPVPRPVPADDQELARRVGPGRLLLLLGPARRLPGRGARAARQRLGRAPRGPDHDDGPAAEHRRRP